MYVVFLCPILKHYSSRDYSFIRVQVIDINKPLNQKIMFFKLNLPSRFAVLYRRDFTLKFKYVEKYF